MIDIHTHLIPGIDDGCRSYEETKRVCEMMRAQGVDRIIATPHYYADNDDPGDFLRRRDRAYDSISDLAEQYGIRKGAEVRYYSGIGMTEEIERLLIEGSGCLLLELPGRRVSEYVARDLLRLRARNIRPIIAHLNRCTSFRDDGFIEFCNRNDILIQLNTECIFDRLTARRALALIRAGAVQFIATDCHNCDSRKPDLKEAVNLIRERLGDEVTDHFLDYEEIIL